MTDNMIEAAQAQVADLTRKAYEKAVAGGLLPAGGENIPAKVDIPKDAKNGDYATSFALAAAKALGKSPRDIAQTLIGQMDLPAPILTRWNRRGPASSTLPWAGSGSGRSSPLWRSRA